MAERDRRNQVHVDRTSEARLIGRHVRVGRTFAFVDAAAFAVPGVLWRGSAVAAPAAPRPVVVPLPGPQLVRLPGVRLAAAEFPPPHLASVTSDKVLYRDGRDVVNLLAVDAAAAGAERALVVRQGG